MKTISELNLGFSDAQNYMLRNNKKMFAEVFVQNRFLEQLIKPSTYYLIGEKGTGKIAYSVYLSNTEYKNQRSVLKFINATDYEVFYKLKQQEHLDVSGYETIWKTILLLLLSKVVLEECCFSEKITQALKLKKINAVIDDYNQNAFSPEIVNALKLIEKNDVSAKFFHKLAEAGFSEGKEKEITEQHFQINLTRLCRVFENCLGSLKLTKDLNMFIDGIDVRPKHIPYQDYRECIVGLANACWSLNTSLFANVRDTKGHFKIVLLLRPDIFAELNLQNATNKLSDNSVYLDWTTTYTEYETSQLYKVANKLLSYDQQDDPRTLKAWEHYFPWKLPSTSDGRRDYDTAFMEFLKISLSRPRDIQTIVKLLQDIMIDMGKENSVYFLQKAYDSDRFQNNYSEYFLSSLKDQLSFYYTDDNYKFFIKFIEMFNNPDFTFDEYQKKHAQYKEFIETKSGESLLFVNDPKEFLQLLYDSNVVAAKERSLNGTVYVHFSYREKSLSNIRPEVPYSSEVTYRFHYGLYKKGVLGDSSYLNNFL